MSIIKPYTFVGGTKARASEVNANFDRLYDQVNTNITSIINAQTAITNLGIDKANVAGNSTQRFAVADATGDYDAINKQTLMGSIANTLDSITGLQISKDSNSPTNTIIVSKGACYDNAREKILKLDNPLSKLNQGQIAGQAYYVYIVGDATATSIDILISLDSVLPSLPEGYTRYRQIGYFNTDGNNAISNIYNYGINPDAPSGLATVVGFYHSGDSGYMQFSNGFIINWGVTWFNGGEVGTNAYFVKPFATASYGLTLSWTARQNAGDKQMNYCIGGRGTNYFHFVTETESFNWQAGYMHWIALGF